MNTRSYSTRAIGSLTIMSLLVLLVSGCGSTGSDSEKLFRSGDLGQGDTFSFTFENEGTVEYFCENHPAQMEGAVTVSSGTQAAATDTVEMQNISFNPSQITVAPGTKVVWINRDSDIHTVTEGNPSSDDGSNY